jgi:hypothetical protein
MERKYGDPTRKKLAAQPRSEAKRKKKQQEKNERIKSIC